MLNCIPKWFIYSWFLQKPPLIQRIWLFARLLLNICESFPKSVALVRIPTATLQCKQSQFWSTPLGIIYQQLLRMLFSSFTVPAVPVPLYLPKACAESQSWRYRPSNMGVPPPTRSPSWGTHARETFWPILLIHQCLPLRNILARMVSLYISQEPSLFSMVLLSRWKKPFDLCLGTVFSNFIFFSWFF